MQVCWQNFYFRLLHSTNQPLIHLHATTLIAVGLFVVRVEQCILLISCPNLLHGLVQLGLVNIELHVGSVVLQILSLEAQIEGTLDPSGAAGDDLGISEGHSLGNVPLAFVEEILISEAWVWCERGVEEMDEVRKRSTSLC